MIGRQWVEELAANLGGESKVYESVSFLCVSDISEDATQAVLRHAEASVALIRLNLGQAAWSGFHGKHVLLVFGDHDDYVAYVSYFYPDGHFAASGGMFLGGGYAHIALPYVNAWSAGSTIIHELTHNLVCHLRLPRWLNEGLAVYMEQLMSRQPFLLDRDIVDRHREFWNEKNIQTFWAGNSFYVPGDSNELSYSLAHILVRLIAEKPEPFMLFVQNANWRDAGQEAAMAILGRDINAIAAIFLGPGDWRPQRVAISRMAGEKK